MPQNDIVIEKVNGENQWVIKGSREFQGRVESFCIEKSHRASIDTMDELWKLYRQFCEERSGGTGDWNARTELALNFFVWLKKYWN